MSALQLKYFQKKIFQKRKINLNVIPNCYQIYSSHIIVRGFVSMTLLTLFADFFQMSNEEAVV